MYRPIIAVTYSSAELEQFTLWRHMFQGIVEAGGVPLAIDTSIPLPDIDALVGRVDGLILGGGGDVDPRRYGGDPDDSTIRGVNPDRDHNEARAWQTARSMKIPVLAICRGAQLLTVELGGELYADLPRDHGSTIPHRRTEEDLIDPAHDVVVADGSRLAHWLGDRPVVSVNSQHHQGIKRTGAGTTATAWSSDGLVEGYELVDEDLVAVQWHPEVLWRTSPGQLALLTNFVTTSLGYAKCQNRV